MFFLPSPTTKNKPPEALRPKAARRGEADPHDKHTPPSPAAERGGVWHSMQK